MYKQIRYWTKVYAAGGGEDRRTVQDFVEVEADQGIVSLRNELQAIAQGKYTDEVLEQIVGKNRKMKHGSYDEWAKVMLQWMATKS